MKTIEIFPLQQELFLLFGDVIEVGNNIPLMINNVHTYRYHALSKIHDIKKDTFS